LEFDVMSLVTEATADNVGNAPQLRSQVKRQVLTILGSTGSIGTSTLDVVARHPDLFSVFALTGAKKVELMFEQCVRFKPTYALMVEDAAASRLENLIKATDLNTQVLRGSKGLDDLAAHPSVDTVMAAIVGAAGLSSCLAAARSGKRLLLANKEALVVGGELFLSQVRTGGAQLLPIDSEHSAIFQSLPEDPTTWNSQIQKIILTASGGPFRNRDPNSLHSVTPLEACRHPNWVMGQKITVDSATMMNKCLEVIEAHYLFGLAPSKIEVVIHPQSIIHSMVEYKDTSVVAQLGTPDMRVPIAFGLGWPNRIESGAKALTLQSTPPMTFEDFDSLEHRARFPGLLLAWQVLGARPGMTGVLNAANEVAVHAFLAGKIGFTQIHEVNLRTLDQYEPLVPHSLEDLLELDARARATAEQVIRALD
jgi:1-deoxy-D-xylulose-5-phosphate reductoisomerase